MTLTNTVTKVSFPHAFTVDIPSIVGKSTAYVGFTGAGVDLEPTGDPDWSYSNLAQLRPITCLLKTGRKGADQFLFRPSLFWCYWTVAPLNTPNSPIPAWPEVRSSFARTRVPLAGSKI